MYNYEAVSGECFQCQPQVIAFSYVCCIWNIHRGQEIRGEELRSLKGRKTEGSGTKSYRRIMEKKGLEGIRYARAGLRRECLEG